MSESTTRVTELKVKESKSTDSCSRKIYRARRGGIVSEEDSQTAQIVLADQTNQVPINSVGSSARQLKRRANDHR